MAEYNSKLKTFSQRPYYDDFAVDKRFLQMLFRPGLAVQARELTQMQTILQEQISRMGNHFFDNGAKIIGGETVVKSKIEYIKLPDGVPSDILFDYNNGQVKKGTLTANITEYVAATDTDPATIYIEYTSAEGKISSFQDTGVYKINVVNGGTGYTVPPTVSIIGTGTGASGSANISSGGIVTSITVTNHGTGYTTPPTITISDPVSGTTATATAEMINTGLTLTVLNRDTNVTSDTTFDINTDVGNLGYGCLVGINDGIYYLNGRFVVVNKHTLIVSKYSDITTSSNTISVGFLITDRIITPEQDSSLFDNAIGSTNESAPGSTRYRMDVELVVRPTTDVDIANYIQLMVLNSGTATTRQNITDYTSLFLEIFARRTYDESGDYIINDFLLDVREHLDDGANRGLYTSPNGGDINKVALLLDPGKAYVRGYEIETTTNTVLTTDKARDTENVSDIFVSNPYDSYVTLDLNPALSSPSNSGSFILFDRSNPVSFKNSSAVTLFTAVPLGIEYISGTLYRLYFTSLTSTTNTSNLGNVTYLTQSGNNAHVQSGLLPGQSPFYINASNTKLLYQIPLSFVKTINKSIFRQFVQRTGAVVDDTIFLTPDSSAQRTADLSNYVVYIGSNYIPITNVFVSGGAATITLPANYDGQTFTVWESVIRTTYNPKIKTKTIIPYSSGESHTVYSTAALSSVKLNHTDVISIEKITIDSNDGHGDIDYTTSYDLDNGQRDDIYDYGRLVLRPGAAVPSQGVVKVGYTYFDHSSSGDFFTVDSYVHDTFVYEDIPLYNGNFLGNMVDLRTSASAAPSKIVPSENIQVSYTYYLSRIDNIVLNNKGDFTVVRGVSSLKPVQPKDIDNSITLYELTIPAFTFQISDINVRKLNYKRYTMKDISNLEKRIESLEYYTELSLLESDIQGKEFLDKFKSGYIVDNFDSLTTSDVENVLHTVAIDFKNNEMRPESVTTAINMKENNLTNCVSVNGVVMLPYTEIPYISQTLASTIERIQPFTTYNWQGKVRLDPSFDNWISYSSAPDLTLDAGIFPSSSRANVLNNKIWDVAARVFIGNEISNNVSGTVSVPTQGNVQFTGGTTRLGFDRNAHMNKWARQTLSTQTNYVGTRVVDVGAVPYIRSRWVHFTITGLKPNTVVVPYFDGRDVSKYCVLDNGNSFSTYGFYNYYHWYGFYFYPYFNSTTPPTFKSNGSGVVSGYFYIPNNDEMKFKTGVRKFEVKDTIENPATSANGYYVANGTNITVQNVFVTTKFVETEVFWYDPLAQSFAIENKDGAFISSIDLFFGPGASDNPDYVTVQIRNMVNGYPGQQVVSSATNYVNNGSYDATIKERFTFNHPIYLEPNKEYAFVVYSNSTALTLWCSELGKKSVRPGDFNVYTGEYINKQPYLGSMFKSQNNTTWTAEQTEDIKFIMNRARFNISSEALAIFSNKLEDKDVNTEADIFKSLLPDSPLSVAYGLNLKVTNGGSGYTTATVSIVGDGTGATATPIIDSGVIIGFNITSHGTGYSTISSITISGDGAGATATGTYSTGKVINVRHPNHGFKDNDTVRLTTPTDFPPTLGGFTAIDINGDHVVSETTIDTYKVTFNTGVNTQSISNGGGNGILATKVVPFSNARIMTDSIILNGTSLNWRLQPKTYISTTGLDAVDVGITEGTIIDLGQMKVVTKDNDASLLLKAQFSSTTDFLSPVIDEGRLTVYGIANRINEFSDAEGNNPTDNTSIARYPTKNITLINPANEIQVYLDTNLLTGCKVDVYCKVSTSPTSASDDANVWKLMTVDSGGDYTDINVFKETKYVFDSESDFTNFVIKIVLSTTISKTDASYRAVVPRCKRFRAIALKK